MGVNPDDLLRNLADLGEAVRERGERQSRKEAGIIDRRQRGCSVQRQQDEYVCGVCGSRWGADEEPSCPRA